MYVCMYVCTVCTVCMYVCMYVYLCLHRHTYIYIYMYINNFWKYVIYVCVCMGRIGVYGLCSTCRVKGEKQLKLQGAEIIHHQTH